MIYLYVILAIVAAVLIYSVWENRTPKLNRMAVADENVPQGFNGFRIAHISDFHNTEFDKDNRSLAVLISGARPDIIVITGDFLDARKTDLPLAQDFARELVGIAPTYYVSGNHESRIDENDYQVFATLLSSLGVHIIDDKTQDIVKNGDKITLYGAKDLSFCESADTPEYLLVDKKLSELKEKHTHQNSQKRISKDYELLLIHRPQYVDCYEKHGFNLVLAGHAHGGQIRIPFIGGILAPEQGFFPKYDAGAYKIGNTTVIVSRGLGNSSFPLRVNNRPEVVLIELVGKEQEKEKRTISSKQKSNQ